jgi:hypothetical protein
MSASEYPKYYEFLKKLTAPRGLNRGDLANLMPGQEIYLVLDGTYSYRPTFFSFTFIEQYPLTEEENSSIILKVVRDGTTQSMEVNCSDFNVEPVDHEKHVTLRRIFTNIDEARDYYDDVMWCFGLRAESQVRMVTYIYKPPGSIGPSSQPPGSSS